MNSRTQDQCGGGYSSDLDDAILYAAGEKLDGIAQNSNPHMFLVSRSQAMAVAPISYSKQFARLLL